MSDQFVSEIRLVPFNFAPKGWAFCTGQLLPISQNTALFSLLGTTYGGDGRSNFALPNLQGMSPLGQGNSAGAQYFLGQTGGEESVTLLQSQMPAHTHTSAFKATASAANTPVPSPTTVLAAPGRGGRPMFAAVATGTTGSMTTVVGGSQPHENRMPYLTLNFIIALQGIYPPRS